MATHAEILKVTHNKMQWNVGRKLTIDDLLKEEKRCVVWVDGVLWTLAPAKYTHCLKLARQNQLVHKWVREYGASCKGIQPHRKELPLEADVTINAAVPKSSDELLRPVLSKEAFIPIVKALDECVFPEQICNEKKRIPYLNVSNKKHEVHYRIIYFGKTEQYRIYDVRGLDEKINDPIQMPFDLGIKIGLFDSTDDVISFIKENVK